MSSELETRALLGRNVTDSYGRNLGRVIALDRNVYGELEAIQIDSTAGLVITAKTKQIAVTPKCISVTPDWKFEVNEVIQELDMLNRRVKALESLKDSGEITSELYKELLDTQRKGCSEKIHEGKQLVDSMLHRLSNTENQISSLTKYLASMKLDHKTGILDESSYQIAEQSVKPSLQSLILEKTDLSNSVKHLEQYMTLK